ncbi:uncharacterized protein LOC117120287 [Anneissia japonica]|uniref:uncharacterized protein LOC117120287 n=1 Tax=Anneissia japonica TaxID=1529436 RepID=UPI001425AEFB|nr:uncharacterized protein LOC117120287 [Anneissia japonica]XP_033121189.1 uncharacterized protein LOC117120287 [Anneissia japonica]
MATNKFILQSALLLCFSCLIQGNELVYFCQSNPVVITCNINLVKTAVLYWYHNDANKPVASYIFSDNSSWPDDEVSSYFPITNKLYIRPTAVEEGDILICHTPHGRKNTKEFILHQFKTPHTTLNCPEGPFDRGTAVKLKCIASGFYPNGSIKISWSTNEEFYMETQENISKGINDWFDLSSEVSFQLLASLNVTCILHGSAMCTGNVTTTCSVMITDPVKKKKFIYIILVIVVIVVVIFVALCRRYRRAKLIIEMFRQKFLSSDGVQIPSGENDDSDESPPIVYYNV